MKNDFKVSDVLFLDYFLGQSRLVSCSTPEVAPIINVRAVVQNTKCLNVKYIHFIFILKIN